MGKRNKNNHNRPLTHRQAKAVDWVIVICPDDVEQAKDYERLLIQNGVPVQIEEPQEGDSKSKIAIKVPQDFLDEAQIVIESQDAYDDFYDLALGGEEEDDSEWLFEDDF